MSRTPQYKIIKQNSYKSLNLLKTIIYQQGGTSPNNSINVFKATTKAQTNFAQVITNENRTNINNTVQTIRNSSLRVCTGATKSTP